MKDGIVIYYLEICFEPETAAYDGGTMVRVD
jgi:hypothetical protein